jgi:hypothetical protein
MMNGWFCKKQVIGSMGYKTYTLSLDEERMGMGRFILRKRAHANLALS